MTESDSTSSAPPRLRFSASVTGYLGGWRYRIQSVLLCFIAMYLGWIAIADDRLISTHPAWIVDALASGICLVIAIFLINDAVDRDIDAVVHPERPIPHGAADWRHIRAIGIALIAASLALAALVNLHYLFMVAIASALVTLYYGTIKRHSPLPCLSEPMAAAISAMFPLAAFAVAPAPAAGPMWAAAGFIFLADLAQDLLGGIHDEAGDRCFHVRTFAVACGAHATRWISAIAFLAALVAGAALWRLGGLGWVYGIAFTLLSAMMLYHYARVLGAGPDTLPALAAKANHLGGVYYFVVSAALLPDALLRLLLR